jgi:hypothetical protein
MSSPFLKPNVYSPSSPVDKYNFVALDFGGDRVVSIHDFLFARYAMDGIDLSPLNPTPRSQ